MNIKKILPLCIAATICGYVLTWGVDTIWQKMHEKRILVMISSWKRPLLLSGQIIRFANQTYDNFDISVSVKGANELWVRNTFMQEWQDLMDSGKLRVRFDENKDQLANLLDTTRDIDINDYDYFCKVDDDDWYAPTYLEEVNEWLNKDENISLSHTRKASLLRNGDHEVWMGFNNSVLSGPTMCFSRKVIEAALKIEKDPAALEPLYSRHNVLSKQGIREDAMLHEIGNLLGNPQHRLTSPYNIIYGQQYPSVIRGNYLK
ncbi:MAG: hypothetical protein IKV03_03275 [Alphaproteobacteria bacterium]|nr:hypothetical protein [Alphaproteobacteria bacterium]